MPRNRNREVMGVLLFQDLAVIPLLILVPSFSQSPEQMAVTMGSVPCSRRRLCLLWCLYLASDS